MPRPLLISSQSDYLIRVFDINSHIYWQTVQIQISWLLHEPTDLDLHCLLWQGMSFSAREGLKTKLLWQNRLKRSILQNWFLAGNGWIRPTAVIVRKQKRKRKTGTARVIRTDYIRRQFSWNNAGKNKEIMTHLSSAEFILKVVKFDKNEKWYERTWYCTYLASFKFMFRFTRDFLEVAVGRAE